MGIGDLGSLGPPLPSYAIIPYQSPIPIFPFLEKNFRSKKSPKKKIVNFIHFALQLDGSGTFERDKIWGWYCIFGILGGHIYLVHPGRTHILFLLGARGGTKKSIFAKKSHSFLESCFKFEGFEPPSLL